MQVATQVVTMSSREIAELVICQKASDGQALRFASMVVGGITKSARAVSRMAAAGGQSLDLANTLLDSLGEQINAARAFLVPLEAYPEAKSLVENTLFIVAYAEATLIPAIVFGSADVSNCESTKTYIVRNPDSGLIKIGKSVNVDGRVKALETGSGQKLEIMAVINEDVERKLHRQFSDLRVFGEWFRDDGRIEAFAIESAL